MKASLNRPEQPGDPRKKGRSFAHVIVFGNEKGGSGKSTAAMHVAIGLVRLGYKVGTVDLDARQGTLTRYLKNREGHDLPSPKHKALNRSEADNIPEQQVEERTALFGALEDFGPSCDFIVMDTPGADSFFSRLAHSFADTIITPMNDSFVDLDLLADIDPDTQSIRGPSIYTKMVQAQRGQRALRDQGRVDWLVMRTRLSTTNACNKREIGVLLEKLSEQFHFHLIPGLAERVIYRELFLKGMTLLDIKEDPELPMTLSRIAARQEVRSLISAINPAKLRGPVKPPKQKAM